MKILILTKYNYDGASSRYRSYYYKKYFISENHTVLYSPLLNNRYIQQLYKRNRFIVIWLQIQGIFKRIKTIVSIKGIDLIIVEKELFPNIPFFLERILLRGKSYTLDYDDYIGSSYKTNWIKRLFLKNKVQRLAEDALFVSVGNRWYFDEIKTNNLYYLPTVVDLDRYVKTKTINQKCDGDFVTIVWIGSPSTVNYLDLVKDALIAINIRHNIKLKVIGAKLDWKNIPVEHIEWTEESEIKQIIEGDIGIMPLNQSLWEKGKCGFKIIQYMACGLPVIASPAPANEEIIVQGQTGFIAKNIEEWCHYLEKLIVDPNLRANMGLVGRKRIVKYYSYQTWGPKYIDKISDTYKIKRVCDVDI